MGWKYLRRGQKTSVDIRSWLGRMVHMLELESVGTLHSMPKKKTISNHQSYAKCSRCIEKKINIFLRKAGENEELCVGVPEEDNPEEFLKAEYFEFREIESIANIKLKEGNEELNPCFQP